MGSLVRLGFVACLAHLPMMCPTQVLGQAPLAQPTPPSISPPPSGVRPGLPPTPPPSLPLPPGPAPMAPDIFPAFPAFLAHPLPSIDPKTPISKLLPELPTVQSSATSLFAGKLASVPEMSFAKPVTTTATGRRLTNAEMLATNGPHIAMQIAKIHFLNDKDKARKDAFMHSLLEGRKDLADLPFNMGDDCRLDEQRGKQLKVWSELTQSLLATPITVRVGNAQDAPRAAAEHFWSTFIRYRWSEAETDEHVIQARLAALMQILGPQTPELRMGLVRFLAGVPHIEATRALAKLAVFDPGQDIRKDAIAALKLRREKHYTDILVKGLRYPWPEVARNAAEAIVQLERADLSDELKKLAEEQDPRLPVNKKVGNKDLLVMRELVRINHHRNCLMCHAPGKKEEKSDTVLMAAVAIPGRSLDAPSGGYNNNSSPDLIVRVDVTYLRQDFSLMQPVADPEPSWPKMQRFDFLVRSRTLDKKQAKSIVGRFQELPVTQRTVYRELAIAALRDLKSNETR